ncbi:TRAP transporter substrate-binding protein [Halalkalibacter krulwichiae]|uniref:Lactate-binding periplasmic protein n=1 Tax=Halalkalibacter krulwichiae TaxID=199441 RepID=A0A1X9M8Y8_9BACI|nr:TRAP transporter substrate-binding protein [Halalkalibacter krulwichiae]ARK29885.1 Lactate-binding periplasmic protein precursor [Halalkalibacter krulwichiae]
MQVKNKSFFIVFLMIGFAFIMAGCGGQSSENTSATTDDNEAIETMDPVTLSFADFFPAPHPAQEQLFSGWAEAIEEATDGLVKVDLYPAGSLLGSGDIYPGVESGIADIGHDVSGYNAGRLPILNAMYLGGVEYQNVAVSSYVARDLVAELNPEELQDTELMFIYGIAPGLLMTNKPVESLEDLKGMQIRASGTNVETLEMLGATPVAMPVSEAYEAMSRGVVDGSLLPPDTLQGFNLAEVTNYVTHSSLIYNTVHYVTMNKDVWNSFPPHIQEAIQEVNEQTFEEAVDLFTSLVDGGLQYAIEEHGVEEIHLSEEEEERWKEALSPLIERHVEELDSAGLNGQEIMDKIVELTEKYNAELGE